MNGAELSPKLRPTTRSGSNHPARDGAQPATLQQIHRTLRAALNEATRRGRIGRNPILPVKSPPVIEKEIEPLSAADAQAVLTVAANRRNGARWAVALSLGLRQGEALGLKWPDIEVIWHHGCGEADRCGVSTAADCPARQPTGTLTVRRALQRQSWQHGCEPAKPCGRRRGAECPTRHSGGLVVVEPKSRAGRRVVSLPTPLVWALLAHREAQDAERKRAAQLWRDERWVFTQPTGQPTDPRADYDEWKALLTAAGVREARLQRCAAHSSNHVARAQRAVADGHGSDGLVAAQHDGNLPARRGRSLSVLGAYHRNGSYLLKARWERI